MKINKISMFTVFIMFAGLAISPYAVFAQGGTITGKVHFVGEAPAPKPINFGAEKQCALVHGDKPPMQEDLVVNPDKTLKWVVVYVKDAKGSFEPPKNPAEIDQHGCVFAPHVSAVMAGQTVRFINNDTLLHNVRCESKLGQSFNVAQPIQGMKTDKVFKQPELGIKLRCDVHFWMVSFLHVFNHPYFAVTGDDGSFDLKGLAPGTYTVEAWHEKLGTQGQTVTVAEGQIATADFKFEKK